MGDFMNYKVEGAIRRSRKYFIVYIILWIALSIVFVAPFTYGKYAASVDGKFDLIKFTGLFSSSITNPVETIKNIFTNNLLSDFLSSLIGFTLIYLVFCVIGIVRSAPKNQYSDIEHGSSDWSQRGEQYQILSNKQGIILAEDNYLPVDKRGNVNVLVVGRFRIW